MDRGKTGAEEAGRRGWERRQLLGGPGWAGRLCPVDGFAAGTRGLLLVFVPERSGGIRRGATGLTWDLRASMVLISSRGPGTPKAHLPMAPHTHTPAPILQGIKEAGHEGESRVRTEGCFSAALLGLCNLGRALVKDTWGQVAWP